MRGRTIVALFLVAVSGLAAAAPAPEAAAAPRPATDELLGFSRYLPPEIDHYVALLQGGRIWRSVADSRAVQRLLDTPELKTFLAEARREFDAQKLPPEGRQALDLLAAAFESEIVVALPSESMPRGLNLFKALGLSAILFVPTEFPADSPPGRLLAQKRKPFRGAWEKSLESLQLPPVVLAARVKDAKRFDAFVSQVLDQGRRGFQEAVARGVPPEIRKALEEAWTVETIGAVTLHRFRLRVEDLVSEEMLNDALEPLPIGDGDRARIVQALRRASLEIHVGFVGEYLTLVVSSDDRLARRIVERYEGKSAETLAASKSFERIRAALSPDAIGITCSDGRRTQKEFEELMTLVQQALDPQFLSLLGAPPEILMTVERLRQNLALGSGPSAVRVEGVDILDRGIRSVRRTEYDAPPPPVEPGPLALLDLVPADATGYYNVKGASWDSLWAMVQNFFDQQAAALAPLKARAADNPQLAEAIRQQEAMAKRILTPIRERLAPALRGEMGFVLGPAVPLSVADVPDVKGIQVPTGAAILRVAEPAKVIEGFRDLVRGIGETVVEMQGGAAPLPVALVKREVEGQEMHVLVVPGLRIEGFEPHVVEVGKSLVLSSSYALTRRIRDAAEGRAPRIAAAPEHAALSACLDPKAWEVSFLDGGRVHGLLQAVAEGIFAAVERESAGREESLRQAAQVKSFVRSALAVVSCFRGHAASRVREGDADVQTEWAHFSDLEAK